MNLTCVLGNLRPLGPVTLGKCSRIRLHGLGWGYSLVKAFSNMSTSLQLLSCSGESVLEYVHFVKIRSLVKDRAAVG